MANEEQSLSVYADVNTTMKPPELIRLRSTLKGKAGIIRIVRDSAGFEEFTQLRYIHRDLIWKYRLTVSIVKSPKVMLFINAY